MFKLSFIIIVFYFIWAQASQKPRLHISSHGNGHETIWAQENSDLIIKCQLLENGVPVEDETVWGKKTLKSRTSLTLNVLTLAPVRTKHAGQYFCLNFKHNLVKLITLNVVLESSLQAEHELDDSHFPVLSSGSPNQEHKALQTYDGDRSLALSVHLINGKLEDISHKDDVEKEATNTQENIIGLKRSKMDHDMQYLMPLNNKVGEKEATSFQTNPTSEKSTAGEFSEDENDKTDKFEKSEANEFSSSDEDEYDNTFLHLIEILLGIYACFMVIVWLSD